MTVLISLGLLSCPETSASLITNKTKELQNNVMVDYSELVIRRGRPAAAQEVGPLDLHRLTLPVVQSQDEVEEVGLAQVGGRLLLKVSPGQTHSTADTHARMSRC
ncbi:hypothetical protein EYF80_025541 [Liparis tanakae]|uniref:Uncharacterized protein n=1 Tax=Liparis tanakae TaxID=230148 RepID=A0A4Z2HFH8_9TELE|nr:hypothetical protein EYF80_025541 [Liparis tanakae]